MDQFEEARMMDMAETIAALRVELDYANHLRRRDHIISASVVSLVVLAQAVILLWVTK